MTSRHVDLLILPIHTTLKSEIIKFRIYFNLICSTYSKAVKQISPEFGQKPHFIVDVLFFIHG